MITAQLLGENGFYQLKGVDLWLHREFEKVEVVCGPPMAPEGVYYATLGAQSRYLKTEEDLRKFMALMIVLGEPKNAQR